jgi:osmotically-inducible protein OsmY
MADRYQDRYRRNQEDRYQGDQYDRGYRRADRGLVDRAGDEVRSWFGDEEAERRRRMDERERERDRDRGREYGRGYQQQWGDYPYRGETWRGGETWTSTSR